MPVDDPDVVVACLQALGVFYIDDDGVYRLEPLLVRSWPLRPDTTQRREAVANDVVRSTSPMPSAV